MSALFSCVCVFSKTNCSIVPGFVLPVCVHVINMGLQLVQTFKMNLFFFLSGINLSCQIRSSTKSLLSGLAGIHECSSLAHTQSLIENKTEMERFTFVRWNRVSESVSILTRGIFQLHLSKLSQNHVGIKPNESDISITALTYSYCVLLSSSCFLWPEQSE